MEIDWSKSPDGAEFYLGGVFYKSLKHGGGMYSGWFESQGRWGGYCNYDLFSHADLQRRPKEWPTDERISAIAQNGGDGLHYDEQREQQKQQAQPAAPQQNKYDRTIIGKYGSGKCTVDVYRVLNAFPTGSPEIDHALKKLLAAGKRGAKDELQDLKEAVMSIEARINYLNDTPA